MKTITLKNGIILNDHRDIGCNIQILNQNTNYIELGYVRSLGFYLNTKGVRLSSLENLDEYIKELNEMKAALEEARMYLL